MDEDEVLGKMTKLLEQGCTMLATHHDCGAPLFRCKGEVVCPVCSFPEQGASKEAGAEVKVEAEPAAAQREGPVSVGEPSVEGSSGEVQLPSPEPVYRGKIAACAGKQESVEEEVRSAILDKLEELAGELREERDLSRLSGQLCCIDSAIKVLRSLSR